MTGQNIFLGLAVIAALSSAVILILIMSALNRRGHNTSMWLARLYTFKYLSDYKKATRKETGKPGLLYYLWIIAINLAAVAAIAGLLSR